MLPIDDVGFRVSSGFRSGAPERHSALAGTTELGFFFGCLHWFLSSRVPLLIDLAGVCSAAFV